MVHKLWAKMLLSSHIVGFFDSQYLMKEPINMLQLLNGGNHQGKVASDATPFGSIWSGVPSHAQNLPRLARGAFGRSGEERQVKDSSELKIT